MGLISLLQSWGATHLLTLDNENFDVADDLGNSADPTRIKDDQYETEWDFLGNPVCEGFSASLNAYGDLNDYTTKVYAGEVDSRGDLNSTNNNRVSGTGSTSTTSWNANRRTMLCWVRSTGLSGGFPTAVWGHGGGTNNQLFILGLGGKLGFQAADAGQPFLITTSIDDVQVGREYFLVGIWERHTTHTGSGNRILFYVNGKLQNIFELTGTDQFPNATGQPFVGNAQSNYQGYGAGTIGYLQRPKEVNVIGTINNVSLTQAQIQEAYESSVLPTVTIPADTVENQQALLDTYIGSNFENNNLAIRIIQATDATDYRLFIDDITFSTNTNILDISVQYMGTHTLTLENANGSNVNVISSPAEVVRASETLVGGGTITIVENTVRLNTVQDISNIEATKIVIEQPGTYNFDGLTFIELENVSGGSVDIISDQAISIITNTNTGSVTNVLDSFLSFSNSWELYNTLNDRDATINQVEAGSNATVFRFQYVPGTTYYLWMEGIKYQVTPIQAGETSVNLSTAALLSLVNENLSFINRIVYCDTRLSDNGDGGNANPFNNLDDAIDKFNQGSYSTISLKTDLMAPATTSRSLDNVKITGANPTAHLVLSGNSMNSGELDNLLIQGQQGNTMLPSTYINCTLVGNTLGLVGRIQDAQALSLTGADITIGFAGNSSVIGMNVTNVGRTILDVTGGISLAIRNITGNFEIANVTAGSTVSVDSISGRLFIDSNCTGGTIRVYDTIKIIDNSNGTILDIEDLPTLEQIEQTEVIAKTSQLQDVNNNILTAIAAISTSSGITVEDLKGHL